MLRLSSSQYSMLRRRHQLLWNRHLLSMLHNLCNMSSQCQHQFTLLMFLKITFMMTLSQLRPILELISMKALWLLVVTIESQLPSLLEIGLPWKIMSNQKLSRQLLNQGRLLEMWVQESLRCPPKLEIKSFRTMTGATSKPKLTNNMRGSSRKLEMMPWRSLRCSRLSTRPSSKKLNIWSSTAELKMIMVMN